MKTIAALYAVLSLLLICALAFGGAAATGFVVAERDPLNPTIWEYRPPPAQVARHARTLPSAIVPAAASVPVAGAAENAAADEEVPAQSFDFDAPFIGG